MGGLDYGSQKRALIRKEYNSIIACYFFWIKVGVSLEV